MKTLSRYHRIDDIILSLNKGQFAQAKEITQRRCRTIPERQARKVGEVVGVLMDIDGDRYNPDLAMTYLDLFDY